MTVTLKIEVTSPLTSDDHDLLSGTSVMLLAIANHVMAAEASPSVFPDEKEAVQQTAPAGCGYVDPTNHAVTCVSEVGHRGRHKFRPPGEPMSMVN